MVHLTSDRLAEAALEESDRLTSDEAAHLDECATCQTELARLQQTVGLLRNAHPESLQRPGRHLWQRIEADLATDPATDDPDAAPEAVRPAGPHLVESRPRRVRRGLVLLAAAAGLVVGIGGTIVASRVGRPPRTWCRPPRSSLFPGTAVAVRRSSSVTTASPSCA